MFVCPSSDDAVAGSSTEFQEAVGLDVVPDALGELPRDSHRREVVPLLVRLQPRRRFRSHRLRDDGRDERGVGNH